MDVSTAAPLSNPIAEAPASSHGALMDRIYRGQRHIYDITRKYYLFGRDRLIDRMQVAPGDHVAEIGCGTGRNLLRLARRHPAAHFHGLDAAGVMIETAGKKTRSAALDRKIHYACGLAENLNAAAMFGVARFDCVFFSYSLSMIPAWPAALEAALANLRPGGQLWAVDFWDQAGYPRLMAAMLQRWLALFHVHHRPELLEAFQQLARDGRGELSIEPVGRRYAYLARFVKAS